MFSVPAHPGRGSWATVPFMAAQAARVSHSPPTTQQSGMKAGDSAAGTTSGGVRSDVAAGRAAGGLLWAYAAVIASASPHTTARILNVYFTHHLQSRPSHSACREYNVTSRSSMSLHVATYHFT